MVKILKSANAGPKSNLTKNSHPKARSEVEIWIWWKSVEKSLRSINFRWYLIESRCWCSANARARSAKTRRKPKNEEEAEQRRGARTSLKRVKEARRKFPKVWGDVRVENTEKAEVKLKGMPGNCLGPWFELLTWFNADGNPVGSWLVTSTVGICWILWKLKRSRWKLLCNSGNCSGIPDWCGQLARMRKWQGRRLTSAHLD